MLLPMATGPLPSKEPFAKWLGDDKDDDDEEEEEEEEDEEEAKG